MAATTDEADPSDAPKTPPLVKGWKWLWLVVAGTVADSIEGSVLTRFLVHSHGWTGASRIALASILPVAALVYLGGIYSQMQSYFPAFRLMIIKSYVLLAAFYILFSPALWRWSGQPALAEAVSYGASGGILAGLAVRTFLAFRYRDWFVRRGGDAWRWEQRLMLTGFALLGGCVAVIVV